MRQILIGLTLSAGIAFSAIAQPKPYCMGVRGNGDLIFAHWPAMARAVEQNGMPQTIAGGSSAAVSLFFMDAISRNELLAPDQRVRRQQQALLVKSILHHLLYLWSDETKAPEIMKAIGTYKKLAGEGFIGKLKLALKVAVDFPSFMEVLGEYGPLVNPQMARGLRENFSFYKGQLAEALTAFGAFDATDKNLFYRNGLIDFKYLAVLIGRVGDYYAAYYSERQPRAKTAMMSFLTQCAWEAKGKIWFDDSGRGRYCKKLFRESLVAYYEKPTVRDWKRRSNGKGYEWVNKTLDRKFANKMVFKNVGSGLSALPTTALVTEDAVRRFDDLLKEYEEKEATDVRPFSLDFDTELSYGYWGRKDVLKKIKGDLKKLYPNDLKSQKFAEIENGNWFEVLATSPAEPGLAPFQRIPDSEKMKSEDVVNKPYFEGWWVLKYLKLKALTWYNSEDPSKSVIPFKENVYSAGGWSDLHPAPVLKAAGCDNTIYITRQNGETVFGQMIFIRLTGYTKILDFWKDINQVNNRKGWINLSPEAEASPWNRLYNLANVNSSFLMSVGQADAVHCTNWDDYSLFVDTEKSLAAMMQDAWEAPVFTKTDRAEKSFPYGKDHTDYQKDGFPGCIQRVPPQTQQLLDQQAQL